MKKKTPQGFYSRNKYIYQISEKSHNVWDLQAAPKFSVILGPRPSPGPENKNFQKMKKKTQVFTQETSIPNFRNI